MDPVGQGRRSCWVIGAGDSSARAPSRTDWLRLELVIDQIEWVGPHRSHRSVANGRWSSSP